MIFDMNPCSDAGTHVPENCFLGAWSVQSILQAFFELTLPRTPPHKLPLLLIRNLRLIVVRQLAQGFIADVW